MTLLKYLLVQVSAYFIEMGAFLISLYFAILDPISANIFSKCCAGLFAFFAQRIFTFRVGGRGEVGRQAFRYFLVLMINIPIASAILSIFLSWISTPALAKFLADVVCVAISFLLSRNFIFVKHKTTTQLANK